MNTTATSFTHMGELITNYAAIKPVDAGHKMQALIDMKGLPLIFAIGNDQKLRVIHQPIDSQAPWETEQIFQENVNNFSVYQSADKKKVRIALISEEDGVQSMLYTDVLSNDFAEVLQNGPLNWISQSLPDDIGKIDRIMIDLDNGLITTKGDVTFYYGFVLGSDLKKYVLPGNGSEIMGVQIGSYMDDQGIFLLYNSNGTPVLVFTPFGTQPGASNIRYNLKGWVGSIALHRTGTGTDQIFCAGDALNLHKNHRSNLELIPAKKDTTLVVPSVSSDESGVTIFLLQQTNVGESKLLYLTNRYLNGETNEFSEEWTSAIPILDDVKQYTSVKGTLDNNHLVVANSHDQLSHWFFDPVSTMWRTQGICIEGPDDILEFDSYTTSMCLEDNTSESAGYLCGEKCYISASGNVKAEVNGVSLQLGPDQPKLTKTDLTGTVSVIMPTMGLDTPLIQIGRDIGNVSEVIDPAHLAMQRLTKINGAEQFNKIRTHDGLPLWNNGNRPSDTNLDQAAKVLGQLVKNRHEMFQEQRAKILGEHHNNDYLQDDTWGAKFEENGDISFLGSQAAKDEVDPNKTSGGFHPFKWIGHAISTVFQGIKSVFQKIRSFVVKIRNKVVSFIIRIGNKIITYVINTIEEIFPFMTYVFDAIKLVFRKVIGFLGAVLGLDDIWVTHKIITKTTRNGSDAQIDYFEKQASSWENYITNNIQDLLEKFDEAGSASDPGGSGQSAFEKVLNAFANPLINFSFYHLQHSGAMKILSKIGVSDLPLVGDYLEQQEKMMKEMKAIIDEEVRAVTHAISHPLQFKKNIIAIIKPFAKRVLEITQGILTGMADALIGALRHAQQMLNTPLKLPFFSAFYKFLGRTYDPDQDWNEDLTFLDLTSLIIAIPTSVSYRIFTLGKKIKNKVPDGFGDREMFDTILAPAAVNELNLAQSANTPIGLTSVPQANQDVDEIQKVIHFYGALGGVLAGFGGALKSIINAFIPEDVPLKVNFVTSLILSSLTMPIQGYDSEEKKAKAAYGLRWTAFIIALIKNIVFQSPSGEQKLTKKTRRIGVLVAESVTTVIDPTADILDWPGGFSFTSHCCARIGGMTNAINQVKTPPNPNVALVAVSFSTAGAIIVFFNSIFNVNNYEKNLHHGIIN
ncbi:hypothetical protein [Shewanella salipaludis]|uniref:Uncharacterized protein n=1 Tax=Shewanella salipaludis TaxID=2723052 RepID=A0A972JH53_9GAMM|nr:hypothetical protein [Shewanella salipaludis]NMH63638.1 hypothetical protein [Shewanella salipaludis]